MTGRPTIDLNADLGEGAGHDEELLDIVTSASIACGAHAGDAATILATCRAAAERGVRIGAHPGYPDRANFGRVPVVLPPAALQATVEEQLRALADGAAEAGASVVYVKAHGALYHAVAADPSVAAAFDAALTARRAPTVLLGPPGASTTTVVEGFADRAYTFDAAGRPTLVDRRLPGALLDHDAAVAQAVALATTGFATSAVGVPGHRATDASGIGGAMPGGDDPALIPVHPRSICVHGDSPGAVALAREIRDELERVGVRVAAFA